MGEHHEDSKDALRRRVRAARRALRREVVVQLGAAVCGRIVALPAFARAHHLVAYAPTENEVDPADAVRAAVAAGKAVYYPRRTADGLEFVAASAASLTPGPGGIPEPCSGTPLGGGGDAVLFLVPGVAFDPRGARLGRGAGCYDRALVHYPDATPIGLAYEIQLVPLVPEAAWDVRMAAVVTEARVLTPKEIPT